MSLGSGWVGRIDLRRTILRFITLVLGAVGAEMSDALGDLFEFSGEHRHSKTWSGLGRGSTRVLAHRR